MNQTQSLIFIKRSQFFLVITSIIFLSHFAMGIKDKVPFICGCKTVVEYVNSLISMDRHITLYLIYNLKKGTITRMEKIRLATNLMQYRLLPIDENNNIRCRFYSYFCIPDTNKDVLYDSAVEYLTNNHNTLNSCYIRNRGREQKVSIFSGDCRGAIEKRMRMIPPPLAIAQAGLESAWGTSYFSTNGYNFFGIQTSLSGTTQNHSKCLPARRNPRRCVYKFRSVESGFFIYSQLLNTSNSYLSLREYRYRSELAENTPCDMSLRMAEGLSRYSEDPNYLQKMQTIIKKVCQIIDSC